MPVNFDRAEFAGAVGPVVGMPAQMWNVLASGLGSLNDGLSLRESNFFAVKQKGLWFAHGVVSLIPVWMSDWINAPRHHRGRSSVSLATEPHQDQKQVRIRVI